MTTSPNCLPPSTPVLASASPRRLRLLADAGLRFRVVPADIDETALPGEEAAEHVARLAAGKAERVAEDYPQAPVIGADTAVVLDGRIFGKPESLAEARAMLALLAGRTHRVLTGVCIVRRSPGFRSEWVTETRVTFKTLSPETIEHYLRAVNPLDKAGAYGIQEHGDMLVAGVDGSLGNVIGLPVESVLRALAEADPECAADPAPKPGPGPAGPESAANTP